MDVFPVVALVHNFHLVFESYFYPVKVLPV